jgi:predicted P-loop ATPase
MTVRAALRRASGCGSNAWQRAGSEVRKISASAVASSDLPRTSVISRARAGSAVPQVEIRQRADAQQRHWNAAAIAVHKDPETLGYGRIKKIGAHRRRRMDAEEQDQQWRHQRSAAHSGHPDQRADAEPGQRVDRLDHPICPSPDMSFILWHDTISHY